MTFAPTHILAADVPENHALRVVINGRSILLTRWRGQLYAISGRCPHAGADLSQGRLGNGRIDCPMHGWKFDITNGRPLYPPDEGRPLRIYPLQLVAGEVWVGE